MTKNKYLIHAMAAFILVGSFAAFTPTQAVESTDVERRGGAGVAQDEDEGHQSSFIPDAGNPDVQEEGFEDDKTDGSQRGEIFQDEEFFEKIRNYYADYTQHRVSEIIGLIDKKFSSQTDELAKKQAKADFVKESFYQISLIENEDERKEIFDLAFTPLIEGLSIDWPEIIRGAELTMKIDLEEEKALARDKMIFDFIQKDIFKHLIVKNQEGASKFENFLNFTKKTLFSESSKHKRQEMRVAFCENLFKNFFTMGDFSEQPSRLYPQYSWSEFYSKFINLTKTLNPSIEEWKEGVHLFMKSRDFTASSLEGIFSDSMVVHLKNAGRLIQKGEKRYLGEEIFRTLANDYIEGIKSIEVQDSESQIKDDVLWKTLIMMFVAERFDNKMEVLDVLCEILLKKEVLLKGSVEKILKEAKKREFASLAGGQHLIPPVSPVQWGEFSKWLKSKKPSPPPLHRGR